MENINNNIIFGTAQFDKNYGLEKNNNSLSQKINFLNKIEQHNCYGIDTALAYKDAQKTIGDWIRFTNKKPRIYTKISNLNIDTNLDNLLARCLNELSIEALEGLFIHNQKEWKNNATREFASKTLEKGLIKSFGMSIYDSSFIPIHQNVQLLQVPGNIFNQEVLNSDQLNVFYENGGQIQVRSIFLQGLLLMDYKNLSSFFEEIRKPLKLFHNIAKESNNHPISIASQCILKLYPKCKLVIGANSTEQLKELLEKININIDEYVIDEVLKLGKKYPHKLWDPRYWQ